MIKKIVKIFSYCLLVMMFSTQVCLASDLKETNSLVENNENVKNEIALYDRDGNIVAFYVSLSNGGYAIVSADGNECIEFSNEDVYGELSDDRVYYYSGPLGLYEAELIGCKEQEKISNLITKENSKIEDVDFFVRTGSVSLEKVNNTKMRIENNSVKTKSAVSRATNTQIESGNLVHQTERYNYNNDGRCGAVAAAIVLKYYYDYRSTEYINSTQVTSDGIKLIDLLTNYYIPTSANYSDMVNGMSNYLTNRFSHTGMRINATCLKELNSINVYTRLKNYVTNDRPIILGLLNHPRYGNHWVVGTGYQRYKYVEGSNVKYTNYACINNGWGNINIFVNFSYIDGCVCF